MFQALAYGEEEPPEIPEGFVVIKPATFTMGSPADELGRYADEAQHEVTLIRAFFLAENEVTQAQWLEAMGSNPSCFTGCDECPVESINWYEAVNYCNALSALEDLEPAYEVDGTNVNWDPSANGYRLPTEAQWEDGCRAGTETAFYNGAITENACGIDPSLDEIGWYCGSNGPQGAPGYGTKVGGQKLSNGWGLYDLTGNVWEWCWDWYGGYPGAVTDRIGPASGTRRVGRGGGWASNAVDCRSVLRYQFAPDYHSQGTSLRPARSAP